MRTSNPYDVVVIGSGGGGLRSAIGSARQGARTLVVTRAKNPKYSGATLLAGANVSADIACDGGSLAQMGIYAGNKDDSKEIWFSDLFREGFFLNNAAMVRRYVDTAPDRVQELLDWGIEILGMEGEREISVYGSAILDALFAQIQALNVDVRGSMTLCDVVTENNKVQGVICADLNQGDLVYIPAKAVVIASGGMHNAFSRTSGGTDLCGEGQAAAFRAGAELSDMEMISYCPTVTIAPAMWKGNILPYILFTTGYGRVLNKFGKTFTDRYLPPLLERLALETEWNKLLLSYAFELELKKGNGTKEGGVLYTIDKYPVDLFEIVQEAFPSLSKGLYAEMKKLFEEGRALVIAPAAHYFEGGIHVNERMETTVQGLYGAGECTSGMFGANRVSAATTEMLVDGAIAGEEAGKYAGRSSFCAAAEDALAQYENLLNVPFRTKAGSSPYDVKRAIHDVMDKGMTVLRSGESLETALEELSSVEEQFNSVCISDPERTYNQEWITYLEVRSLLPVCRCMLLSALERKESRGVHIRTDHFYTDNDHWKKNIIISGDYKVRSEPAKNDLIGKISGQTPYVEYILETAKSLNEI